MKNLKTRFLAFFPGVAILASTFAAPASVRADDSKNWKYGAVALGVLGAHLLGKGKEVEGAAALGGAYYAYKKGEDKRQEAKDDRYDQDWRRSGYDRNGYNRDGYNRAGYDRYGYNRNGYNHSGYNRAGYNRDGFNRDGYDRNGYNCDGYNRSGLHRDGYRQGDNRNARRQTHWRRDRNDNGRGYKNDWHKHRRDDG